VRGVHARARRQPRLLELEEDLQNHGRGGQEDRRGQEEAPVQVQVRRAHGLAHGGIPLVRVPDCQAIVGNRARVLHVLRVSTRTVRRSKNPPLSTLRSPP
jgi:hypothetical protein